MEKLNLKDALTKALEFPHPREPSKTLPAYALSHNLELSPSVVNKMLNGDIKTIRLSSAMILSEMYGIELDPAYISGDERAATTSEDHKTT